MHGLTGAAGWERAMEGTLRAFIEAREKGLVRYLGVTGHGLKAPGMHRQSLERFDFDSVMLAYNYSLMQNPRYASEFNALVDLCQTKQVAFQTFKSVSRCKWEDRPKTHNTYFYQPLEEQVAIDKSVHWALGLPDSFVITAGDMQILPKMLTAASRFKKRPAQSEMSALDRTQSDFRQLNPPAQQCEICSHYNCQYIQHQ
jgi:predicted aldo/keto reductase-like oxidoreductase